MNEQYHKNTLKNVGGAINRHLKHIGRNIDIVRVRDFQLANKTLDGLFKSSMVAGTSRPTKHKEIISTTDLAKIHSYLKNAAKKKKKKKKTMCMCMVSAINSLCQ